MPPNSFHHFPSINQFRTVVKYVNDRCGYHDVEKPTLKFRGTTKLHGTNAAVVIENGTVRAQSRERIISVGDDNAGFAAFVEKNAAAFLLYGKQLSDQPIAIFGEWCGQGIMKGTAISKVSKRFIIFAIKYLNREETSCWLTPSELESVSNNSKDFFNKDQINFIYNYGSFEISIDFNDPAESQNDLIALTNGVEEQCPVGTILGVEGIGEGIVWVCDDTHSTIQTNDLIFKVKGAKHSDTKTTNLAAVDVEKMKAVKELAEAVCTGHRLEKGIAAVQLEFPNLDVLDNLYIGPFLKWVGQDILKEELDMIQASGFDQHEVTKAVGKIAREWFKEQAKLK